MLSINISELVLTVLNFLLLLFVLNRLLFKPLIAFMDARQARIDAGLNKEHSAEDEAKSNREHNQALEEQRRREAEQRIAESGAEDQRLHEQFVRRLNDTEQAELKAAKEDMEHFEDQERAELESLEDELARLLAARLSGGD